MSRSLLVVDGLEGTGKSTLIKPLSNWLEAHPIKIHDRTSPLNGRLEALAKQYRWPYCGCFEHMVVARGLATLGVDAILDRSMVSSVVYGLCTRGSAENLRTMEEARAILDHWLAQYTEAGYTLRFISLTATRGVCRERLGQERGKVLTEARYRATREAFADVSDYLTAAGYLSRVFDVTEPSPGEVFDSVFKWLRRSL